MSAEPRKVITVDGLASTGKSTLSRELAKKLGYTHFNSGLLYRAVGFLALDLGVQFSDPVALKKLLDRHTVTLILKGDGSSELLIDGSPFGNEGELSAPEVSEAASITSQHQVVRDYLIEMQRGAFPGRNIVAEGRDMGTVVFPEASLKFFVEASDDVRASRRLNQLIGAQGLGKEGQDLQKQLKIEILERDERDRTRTLSPVIPAPDAIIIDNSSLSLTQVVQKMYDFASQKGLT